MGSGVWQRLTGRLSGWPLRSVPGRAQGWIAAVVGLVAVLVAVEVPATSLSASDLACCLALTACAAVCIEVGREPGEPAGVAKDLLSAWTLPVALLLPPVFSLLVPVPLTVLLQRRVRGGLLYRRAYSVAAIGLGNWAASTAFHTYLSDVGTPDWTSPTVRTVAVLAAFGAGALGALLNLGLIAVAVRLAVPGTTWRELLANREDRVLEAGEICLGVVVAGCWTVSPVLALGMLLPVLLVQRSLTHAQLRAAARTDAKTGLLNAQAWQEEAEREIVRSRREHQPLAVLVADLDHFKRINDAYGHLAGDTALLAAVQALIGGLRPYDQLGRFGGEEFTVVLPRTSRGEARRIAERLRRAVAASPVLLAEDTVHVTVSIGVAVLDDHGDDLTDLLTAADHALYLAKQDGRDRVAVAPGEALGRPGRVTS